MQSQVSGDEGQGRFVTEVHGSFREDIFWATATAVHGEEVMTLIEIVTTISRVFELYSQAFPHQSTSSMPFPSHCQNPAQYFSFAAHTSSTTDLALSRGSLVPVNLLKAVLVKPGLTSWNNTLG